MIDALVCFAYDWQTLITGALALIAAWWTVRQIREQIDLQKLEISVNERRHEEAQRRKSQRARAFLPDALSGLPEYTSKCFKYVSGVIKEIPNPPESALSAIKEAIEYVDSDASDRLIELVNFYQIHNSRLAHFQVDGGPVVKMEECLYDSVKLRWLTNRMFSYARHQPFEADDRRDIREQMLSALHNCVGFDEYLDDLNKWKKVRELIELKHPDK